MARGRGHLRLAWRAPDEGDARDVVLAACAAGGGCRPADLGRITGVLAAARGAVPPSGPALQRALALLVVQGMVDEAGGRLVLSGPAARHAV
ncbi:MAG: hypothetical protein MUE51_09725 [Thermoleophilia bacterium]|nr:hypothetical protein [Thermoleophilia bacterium]